MMPLMRRSLNSGLAKLAAALTAFAVVAGCSGGFQETSTPAELGQALQRAVQERTQPRSQAPNVTRAVLDTLDGSFMKATVENIESSAFLFVSAERRDNRPGLIRVWRTEDNSSLTLRQGVLTQTRGFGTDLLSSEVSFANGVLGPARGGQRRMVFLALDNKAVPLSGVCDVTDLGPEKIVIIERAYATRHVRERCEFSNGEITNDYWIDSGAGIVWKSRQWAGPEVGYITLERVTR